MDVSSGYSANTNSQDQNANKIAGSVPAMCYAGPTIHIPDTRQVQHPQPNELERSIKRKRASAKLIDSLREFRSTL